MNRTIQEATVNKYFYKNYYELNEHLSYFLKAYNCGKRLKTLKGLTPYEFIIKMWQNDASKFIANPHYHTPGLYIKKKSFCLILYSLQAKRN
jgi:hypothetical protein